MNSAVPEKVNWNKADPEIKREGTQIILPDKPGPMPIKDAITALERKLKDEETILFAHEIIDAYPLDGAVAFIKAMKNRYGWASPMPTPGFFGPTPPQLRPVRVGPGPDDFVQVPWGAFKLPGIEEHVNCGSDTNPEGQPVFVIYGKVRKREQHILQELAQDVRNLLKTDSIYRGKAIRLKVDENDEIDYNSDPEFMRTDNIRPNELILNRDEREQVETSLWTPIEYTDLCRKNKIPLKRSVLLSGVYGTGKTLTATVTSKIAVDNGWTYIYLDRVEMLHEALMFAKRYAPAVIFSEDIDRVAAKRDQRGNDLLNMIDGILTKSNVEIITVLTTNHVDRLNKAMLRPGRLDAVINIAPPDMEAVQQLVRLYARDLLDPNADLTEVGVTLAGTIPATIREVVERSKLAMIRRQGDVISADDLLVAARGMQGHLELLTEHKPALSADENLGRTLRESLVPSTLVNGEMAEIKKDVVFIRDKVRRAL